MHNTGMITAKWFKTMFTVSAVKLQACSYSTLWNRIFPSYMLQKIKRLGFFAA